MRSARTEDEMRAVSALQSFLIEKGYSNPAEVDDWVDKPDVIFKTGSGRIACEIANVVPDTIIQWYFKKNPDLPISSIREIILPLEPHEWAKRIINSKNSKFNSYKQRAITNKIWLLIHTSEKSSDILRPPSTEDLNLMRYGAASTKHQFKKILFFDYDKGITELYDHKNRQEIRINYHLKEGYPTIVIREVTIGPFCGLPEKSYAEVEVDFSALAIGDRIVLPPFDSNFAKVKPNIAMPSENPKLILGNPSSENRQVEGSLAFPEFYAKKR